MKILALTRYGRLGASSRLRMFQYSPSLQALGIAVESTQLLGDEYLKRLYDGRSTSWHRVAVDYFRRLLCLLHVRSYDLLWIEKELFPFLPAWFESGLHSFGVPYVADYDDAIFHQYEHGSLARRWLLGRKIDAVMRNAALVVGGNQYLADRAVAAGAPRVEVIPTVIDLERYPLTPRRHALGSARPWVVGWIGSPSTVKYLDLVAPVLTALAAEFPIVLRVVGAPFSWPGLQVDCRPWNEASEVAEILDFDVGVMPLLDSPWERGKCGYKLIQYMACERPVVASPVGANRDIVQHECNGFLPEDPSQWAMALRRLAGDSDLAHEMGRAGRRTVERDYCLGVTAPKLAKLFREVVVKGQR